MIPDDTSRLSRVVRSFPERTEKESHSRGFLASVAAKSRYGLYPEISDMYTQPDVYGARSI
jgi:hypothetical protein